MKVKTENRFKIEKFVPEFKTKEKEEDQGKRGRKSRFPFHTLKPGYSFLIPNVKIGEVSPLAVYANKNKKYAGKIHCRTEGDSVRVYEITKAKKQLALN